MSNISFTREAFERALNKHGQTQGKGANAIIAAGSDAIRAAAYNTDVTADSAAFFYEIYARGAASVKGVAYERASSFPQQVSKFANFLKIGQLHTDGSRDMIDMFDRTLEIIREYAAMPENPMKGSAYENIQRVLCAQLSDTYIGAPMTDDQIRGALTQEGKEKTALEKLISQYKANVKLHDLDLPNDAKIEIEASVEALAKAITAAGGEIPASKEEKAEARKLAALVAKLPAGYRIAAE